MLYLLIIAVVLIVIFYGWYVVLISRRNSVTEALSGVDVQLQKRSNLIPNVLTIAQKYMDYERQLLDEITQLREAVDQPYDPKQPDAVRAHLQAAGALGKQMGHLMIRAEAYPDLRAAEPMVQAQRTYNEVEAQIAAARRFYNSSVNSLNTAAQIFPGSIIAGMAGVKTMPSFEADEQARSPVNAGDYLR